jgi:hypothetical protein
MTRRGWILSVLAGLLVTGGLVWPAMAAAQAIKVGTVVPLTGRYAAGGAQVRAGYEIAIEDVNRAGGVPIGGTKVPLIEAGARVLALLRRRLPALSGDAPGRAGPA